MFMDVIGILVFVGMVAGCSLLVGAVVSLIGGNQQPARRGHKMQVMLKVSLCLLLLLAISDPVF